MRTVNCWYIFFALVIALLLILASASGAVPVALPVIALLGLGLPAAVLLLEHRQKMHEILGPNNTTLRGAR